MRHSSIRLTASAAILFGMLLAGSTADAQSVIGHLFCASFLPINLRYSASGVP